MAYVLRRTSGKPGYVAEPGSRKSYTTSLDRARRFSTEEDARANKCGNEAVQQV